MYMSDAKVDPSFHIALGEASIANRRMKEFDSDCITTRECCPVAEEANRPFAKVRAMKEWREMHDIH